MREIQIAIDDHFEGLVEGFNRRGILKPVKVTDLTASTGARRVDVGNPSQDIPPVDTQATNAQGIGTSSTLLISEVATALDRSRREGR